MIDQIQHLSIMLSITTGKEFTPSPSPSPLASPLEKMMKDFTVRFATVGYCTYQWTEVVSEVGAGEAVDMSYRVHLILMTCKRDIII